MKFARALLGSALAAAAVVTFQLAVAPSASAEDRALCLNCWCVVGDN